MISGKEALIALANGEEVEYRVNDSGEWGRLNNDEYFPVNHVLNEYDGRDESYKFRLKPRTITLNGIEVPAPFEPKVGEYIYFISSDEIKGYAETTLEDTPMNWGFIQFGAWRTEEEIKQVVEALRNVFNP